MFAAGGGRIDRGFTGFTGRRHGNDDAVAAVPGALTAFQATVAAASQALTVAAALQTPRTVTAPFREGYSVRAPQREGTQ